ncbi:3-dehydroquinate synthase [Spirulina subsalsa FACHB-351]|uniref:3-dehydroquinate synthase n=1 Tax=Spirulina subsalsa FACHB-351 TaxID=234711 RepID=A0ABT3L8I2_9CYAN|nr:3-dehydroquinate synthase [Spirulina subsalsa]MCW6037404.1 3-dehydroquinate synthase [Spirulina subsalsa FACHB-351]
MSSLIAVNLPDNSYNIAIAPDSLSQLGEQMRPLGLGHKVLVISNPEIFHHYGAIIVQSLEQAGYTVSSHLIPAGESYKTLDSIARIYDTALQHRLERSSTLVALGGGVIGDLTGFAAATWLRGINFVQVPTSLLAMVDASVGGKTGVNHPQGKNLIGAFYQPKLVFIDPQVLRTLPPREFRAGMAEVIKYGVIWDEDLFTQLEKADRLQDFSDLEAELLQVILTRSCQAKADVVSQDERESGLRAILNYGHTIGHAIESLTGYSRINHGEAVGIGMVAAGAIALKMQLWTEPEASRQNALISKTGLLTHIPEDLDTGAIVESLQMDKKVKSGKVRFILPTQLGKVKITDEVPNDLLGQVIDELKQ